MGNMDCRDQSLEKPIDKIVEGIRGFRAATVKRMESHDWSIEHTKELDKASLTLLKIERLLLKLKSEYAYGGEA